MHQLGIKTERNINDTIKKSYARTGTIESVFFPSSPIFGTCNKTTTAFAKKKSSF